MNIFFFNDTATTEIYTLSLHDALPIYRELDGMELVISRTGYSGELGYELYLKNASRDGLKLWDLVLQDRKSTRLNSSHANISYAVFCLKKKQFRSPWPWPSNVSGASTT